MMSDDGAVARQGAAAPRIDTTVAHPARRYNYWLGGKDHFAADRESGDAVLAAFPTARAAALENRAFMGRAVAFLAREAGVRQFLDIGTGIPAPGNVHEVVQAVQPSARVVYVDNDPIVMTHVRALLGGSPPGTAAYLEADLREPAAILSQADLTATLDLREPVGLVLVAILHFLPDDEDPHAIVRALLSALPTGSYLVASHGTADHAPSGLHDHIIRTLRHGRMYPRRREEFGRFFDGLELIDPGVVSVADWRAPDGPRLTPFEASTWGAVGRIR